MPLFDFKCSKCGEVYEVLVRADTPTTPMDCPPGLAKDWFDRGCGEKGTLEKQLSAPNIELKGSGWARDNYS